MFRIVNNLKYHYNLTGEGTPLVVLHGFTGSSENWWVHAQVFSKQFQVIAVDLPGHGKTESPEDADRYRMEQVAADVIDLIQQGSTPPVHLLGYSMGARLALYLAVHYPDAVQSLILESGSPGLADAAARAERVRQDEALAKRIEREGIEAFVDYWERIPLFASQQRLSAEQRQRLREQRLRNQPHGLANSLRGMGTGVQPSLWDKLSALHTPVLLLAGALDTKFVGIAKQMYDLLPDARLVVVPDAGHTIHLEAPAVFQSHILDFLTRQQGASC